MHLHAAAQHLHQVCDDVAFEDAGIVRLQTVQYLAPDGHQSLELRVPALLARAQCGVALHDVDLPAAHVLGAAVHKLLHPVGDVDLLGELFLLVDAGALRRLPAPLVHQHLGGDLLRRLLVLNEVDLHPAAEELRHGLLDELVGDGLLRLVLIAGLCREVVAHQNEAVLHVGKGDLRLALDVFIVVPQVLVDGGYHGRPRGLLRAAAVLQKAGVVVMLTHRHPIGEAQRHVELHLVLLLVRPVAALPFRRPAHRLGQRVVPGQLLDVVRDAVGIQELLRLELPGGYLVLQPERHPGVDHRLPLHHVPVVVQRHGDVGEHLQVGQPADGRARAFFAAGLVTDLQLAHDLAPLKVQPVLLAVPPHRHVHVPGGVLGGARAQPVQTQGELVVLAALVVVLAAGVQLAEHQLPVVPPLFFVPVHRAAPAHILHLHRVVGEAGHGDELAVATPGLVDSVGQDLEHRVLAALQPVRAEDNTGPLPYPVRPLQAGDALVVVYVLLCHSIPPAYTDFSLCYII